MHTCKSPEGASGFVQVNFRFLTHNILQNINLLNAVFIRERWGKNRCRKNPQKVKCKKDKKAQLNKMHKPDKSKETHFTLRVRVATHLKQAESKASPSVLVCNSRHWV